MSDNGGAAGVPVVFGNDGSGRAYGAWLSREEAAELVKKLVIAGREVTHVMVGGERYMVTAQVARALKIEQQIAAGELVAPGNIIEKEVS